jgi:hypothetical protein
MKLLPSEMEERFGVAHAVMIPVGVTQEQLQMLQAAENESHKGWNFMLLIFSGAKIIAQEDTTHNRLRLPEIRMTLDSLDPEDIEDWVKDKVYIDFGIQIELSRYLILAHCTFMTSDPYGPDDKGVSNRTLHLFTARATNSEGLTDEVVDGFSPVKLLKPAQLLDRLQSEWADVKAYYNMNQRSKDLRRAYDDSWTFPRARIAGMAFQQLFGWQLPEI